jgi:hypothetical protein
VLAHGHGAQAQIPLELRFDGQPFDPKAPPEFTCLSASLGRQRAVEITREALARYGNTVRADDLRRTLARFELEQSKAQPR